MNDYYALASDTVQINRKTYEQLVSDSQTLRALYAAGVDNWEGYTDALADLNG